MSKLFYLVSKFPERYRYDSNTNFVTYYAVVNNDGIADIWFESVTGETFYYNSHQRRICEGSLMREVCCGYLKLINITYQEQVKCQPISKENSLLK